MFCTSCNGKGSIAKPTYVGGDGWESRWVICPNCDGYGFEAEEPEPEPSIAGNYCLHCGVEVAIDDRACWNCDHTIPL